MDTLPQPPQEALIFEDDRLYVCLASYPLTRGHVVVVWKNHVPDLHLLAHEEHEYLMDVVSLSRDALLKVLKLEKVYLVYMDEVKQVHWHLIPRYDEQGFNMLAHTPKITHDFSLAPTLKAAFEAESNADIVH